MGLAELEAAERRSRQSSNQDVYSLVAVLDCFKGLVVTIHDVVKKLQASSTAATVEVVGVEVDAARDEPAGRIVSEIDKLFTSAIRWFAENNSCKPGQAETPGQADAPGQAGTPGQAVDLPNLQRLTGLTASSNESEAAGSAGGGRGSPRKRVSSLASEALHRVSDLHGKVR